MAEIAYIIDLECISLGIETKNRRDFLAKVVPYIIKYPLHQYINLNRLMILFEKMDFSQLSKLSATEIFEKPMLKLIQTKTSEFLENQVMERSKINLDIPDSQIMKCKSCGGRKVIPTGERQFRRSDEAGAQAWECLTCGANWLLQA